MKQGISRKIHLRLDAPSEADSRSDQRRILDALAAEGLAAYLTLRAMQSLPLCAQCGWDVTAHLAWDGARWALTALCASDDTARHYGYAADLGSTGVVMQLIDCGSGAVIAEESAPNGQIAWGDDILTRIFACKGSPETLRLLQKATLQTLLELMAQLAEQTGVAPEDCISMVVSGNTTMIHFLLGMDPFCVFSAPYAVHADRPEFVPAAALGLPLSGYVYCVPGKSNYIGGDIISGMLATGLYRREEICVFFDIGTNGELVVGNRDFLLCGAGAAGPALEGGVVRTGMRAACGAVDHVRLQNGRAQCHVIGGGAPKGICGSGIVDLIAELFLSGLIDLRGRLQPETSPLIAADAQTGELSYAYAPDLRFYQSDIDEFIRTKSAAATMVEYMLREAGIPMDAVADFYAAGAFGNHVDPESAVTIGMYPDMPREHLIPAGNTSLAGARMLLLDRSLMDELDGILEKMTYIQFAQVTDFVQLMVAAQALPHTDLSRYPDVAAKLAVRRGATEPDA